jgi:hypothetical protein
VKSDYLKNIVKEKYGKIAELKSDEKSSCFGSTRCSPDGVYTVFSDN